MDVLWVLLIFNCFFRSYGDVYSANANNTEPIKKETEEFKLFPPNPTYAGQTRMPRTLFKKLHSKAAFLTGLKLGAILSKKGFELGHGKIASTHSFQIFGKSVNSAMSLSYGDRESVLPLVDDDPGSKANKRTGLNEEDQKVYHVTVIENLSNGTKEDSSRKEEEEEKENEDSDEGNNDKGGEVVPLYQDTTEKENEKPEEEVEVNFLKEHNKRVKEFNESFFRRKNSKF